MTKLDAIQQKIDAARAKVAQAQAAVSPAADRAARAQTAFLKAHEDEAHYTQIRQDTEGAWQAARADHQQAQGALAQAQAEQAKWEALWEKALEE
jgi:hypothetical protein